MTHELYSRHFVPVNRLFVSSVQRPLFRRLISLPGTKADFSINFLSVTSPYLGVPGFETELLGFGAAKHRGARQEFTGN